MEAGESEIKEQEKIEAQANDTIQPVEESISAENADDKIEDTGPSENSPESPEAPPNVEEKPPDEVAELHEGEAEEAAGAGEGAMETDEPPSLEEEDGGGFEDQAGQREINGMEEGIYEDFEEEQVEGEPFEEASAEENETLGPLLPIKDYGIVDPSFLDEFDSSLEEVLKKEEICEEEVQEVSEETESVDDDDRYAIYDIPSPAGLSDVYCAGDSAESTDSLFSDQLLTERKKRDSDWLRCPSKGKEDEVAYLKQQASPELVSALAEVALYQPTRPVEYISHYLARAAKTREELGLDPDPRVIQELVDRHERALELERRRHRRLLTLGESSLSTSSEEEEEEKGKAKEAQASLFSRFREKYQTDMKKLNDEKKTTQQTKERIRRGGKEFRKFFCLGPTTLVRGYLPADFFPKDTDKTTDLAKDAPPKTQNINTE